MPAPSLVEAITQSFYTWEQRGRGWWCTDYIVELEPPHRPFFLLPEYAHARTPVIDDGRRPTLFSTLANGVRSLVQANARVPKLEPYDEQQPFPGEISEDLATFTLLVPQDHQTGLADTERLLTALAGTQSPLSLEFVGNHTGVALQLSCNTNDQDHVASMLAGFLPRVTIVPEQDNLCTYWNAEQPFHVLDLGLAQEFFLPIGSPQNFGTDPYIALVSALSRVQNNECLVFQVLFERTKNTWGDTILDAVDDGNGGCIFSDAPEFLPLAKEKTETPLFATVLRIGASAADSARVQKLIAGMQGFLDQYARPGSNHLIPLTQEGWTQEEISMLMQGRLSCHTGMLLSLTELTGLVHIPDASVVQKLVRPEERYKVLPDEAMGHDLILGHVDSYDSVTQATLRTQSRFAHMHVVGASGTGKTSFLLSLIEQDLVSGEGIAVIDPHGDLTDDILARIPTSRRDDVIVFDPSDTEWPLGFNVLGATTEHERTLLTSDLVATFERLATSWGDTMSTVLAQAVLALLSGNEARTLLDLRRFLVDDAFRRTHLRTVHDDDVHYFWNKEFPLIGTRAIGPLITRLDVFLRSKLMRNILGQREAKLDIGHVMQEGKILLVKLSLGLMGEENAKLLGSLLVSKFQQCALARQTIPKPERRPFFLYIDECQHFVTPSLAAVYGEGRKYALGLTLSHQYLSQLDTAPKVKDAVLGAYTRVTFRVSGSDARTFAEGCSFFERQDFEQLHTGEAIVRLGSALHDFKITTEPPSVISPREAAERTTSITAHSRTQHATPRDIVETQFSLWYPRHGEASAKPEVQEKHHPLKPQQPQKTDNTELPPSPQPRPAPVSTQALGKGGEQHKRTQYLIKKLAEERGFRAVIEEKVPGGFVDIALYRDALKIACEISITTDTAHEVQNIQKCLTAGFTQVVFLSASKAMRERVVANIRNEYPDAPVIAIDLEGTTINAALDVYGPLPEPENMKVKGYTVKIKRQTMHPPGNTGRDAVAEVMARALTKEG